MLKENEKMKREITLVKFTNLQIHLPDQFLRNCTIIVMLKRTVYYFLFQKRHWEKLSLDFFFFSFFLVVVWKKQTENQT